MRESVNTDELQILLNSVNAGNITAGDDFFKRAGLCLC